LPVVLDLKKGILLCSSWPDIQYLYIRVNIMPEKIVNCIAVP